MLFSARSSQGQRLSYDEPVLLCLLQREREITHQHFRVRVLHRIVPRSSSTFSFLPRCLLFTASICEFKSILFVSLLLQRSYAHITMHVHRKVKHSLSLFPLYCCIYCDRMQDQQRRDRETTLISFAEQTSFPWQNCILRNA